MLSIAISLSTSPVTDIVVFICLRTSQPSISFLDRIIDVHVQQLRETTILIFYGDQNNQGFLGLKSLFWPYMVLLTGEEATNMLANKKDWPLLYNVKALNSNKVPIVAAVYYEDMFVNFNVAMETSKEIRGIRLWVTYEYMHSGLRDGATHVLDRLMVCFVFRAQFGCAVVVVGVGDNQLHWAFVVVSILPVLFLWSNE